jgi:maltooligosyltrehalose trehalohydrolase
VAATGRGEAYYSDYGGTPQEFISSLRWGFLYQGQYYAWQEKPRGVASLDLPAEAFVNFLQNHDQVANSASGERLHQQTSPGVFRALTALLLLAPSTPLLFQGQEFCASSPFLYFADHQPDLAKLVEKGRKEFLSQFPSIEDACDTVTLDAPHDQTTFLKCKLDHGEREKNAGMLALHRDLLRLRRDDPIFAAQRSDWIYGAVIGPNAFVVRFFGEDDHHRLLIVNLGTDLRDGSIPEPLLVAPPGRDWRTIWTSEDPRYGGLAPDCIGPLHQWRIPSHSATVLKSE